MSKGEVIQQAVNTAVKLRQKSVLLAKGYSIEQDSDEVYRWFRIYGECELLFLYSTKKEFTKFPILTLLRKRRKESMRKKEEKALYYTILWNQSKINSYCLPQIKARILNYQTKSNLLSTIENNLCLQVYINL